jgi:hypothetical protein
MESISKGFGTLLTQMIEKRGEKIDMESIKYMFDNPAYANEIELQKLNKHVYYIGDKSKGTLRKVYLLRGKNIGATEVTEKQLKGQPFKPYKYSLKWFQVMVKNLPDMNFYYLAESEKPKTNEEKNMDSYESIFDGK